MKRRPSPCPSLVGRGVVSLMAEVACKEYYAISRDRAALSARFEV